MGMHVLTVRIQPEVIEHVVRQSLLEVASVDLEGEEHHTLRVDETLATVGSVSQPGSITHRPKAYTPVKLTDESPFLRGRPCQSRIEDVAALVFRVFVGLPPSRGDLGVHEWVLAVPVIFLFRAGGLAERRHDDGCGAGIESSIFLLVL